MTNNNYSESSSNSNSNTTVPVWRSYINGEIVVCDTQANLTHLYNPANVSQIVSKAQSASGELLEKAINSAKNAFLIWGQLKPSERVTYLTRFVNCIENNAEKIAQQMTLEQGKIIAESRGEVAKAIGEARYMIGESFRIEGCLMPSERPDGKNIVERIPLGVIAAINPWNFPVSTPMRKIMPALVAGNTIVLKPAEATPGPLLLIAEAAIEAGIPAGVINVVVGSGKVVGRPLCDHPDIGGISFTGSTSIGKKIAAVAANNLIPAQLEMGGKNAVVVCESANLEQAVEAITKSALVCSGQRCTAISRIIVSEKIAPQLSDLLVAAFKNITVGAGLDNNSQMGPLISEAHLREVDGYVQRAVAEGANVLIGGKPIKGEGHCYPATLVDNVLSTSEIVKEEVFGPVVTLQTFDSLDKAIKMHNDTQYGLTSAIFSCNINDINYLSARVNTGMLHINAGTFPENNMPFTGVGHSSLGAPSVGKEALHAFTRIRSVYL